MSSTACGSRHRHRRTRQLSASIRYQRDRACVLEVAAGGPSSGRVASWTAMAAPCPGVRTPRKPFRSVATKPGHAASVRVQLRDGHAVVPVVDAPDVTTLIAWPPQSTSRALAALVRTSTRL